MPNKLVNIAIIKKNTFLVTNIRVVARSATVLLKSDMSSVFMNTLFIQSQKLFTKKNNVLAIFLLSVANYGSALAYDKLAEEAIIKENQMSEYAPHGIRTGTFIVLPKMDFINQYDTNIYKYDKRLRENAEVDSYVAHFKPGFGLASDWSRHALNLKFDTDFTQYASQGNQNDYQDIFTRLDGRLDVFRDSHLNTAFSYNSIHEDRGSPDQISGNGPTFYDTKNIDAFYTHKFNRASIKGGVEAVRYDYQDLLTLQNTVLAMSTRNHWEYAPSIKLAYEIQPEYEVFVKVIYKEADYDTAVLSSGDGIAYNRNSSGYNALAGLAFDLTGLVTGDMSVGYLQRSYEDTSLPNISGINGFINLKWRPTALTTVNGKVSHDIGETTQAGVAGVLTTGVTLNIEHELMRNVILTAGGGFSNNDYQGFVAPYLMNRNDKNYGGSVGAKYLLNRNLSTDLSYSYQSRDVNYLFSNYEVNQVMLNFRGQY